MRVQTFCVDCGKATRMVERKTRKPMCGQCQRSAAHARRVASREAITMDWAKGKAVQS